MRWRLDGDGDQPHLFEEEVERHIGRGEFRGMEFLHVRAGRIINEVPKASPRPVPLHDQRLPGLQPRLRLLLRPADPRVPRPRHRPRLRQQDRRQGQRRRAAAGRAGARAGGPATTSPWAPTPTPTSGARASTTSPGGSSRCWRRRRNSFSILTKSTLVLRDLDLLAEAAKRTDVWAGFSIGTLDEEVWKLTEPGTPHPLRRVEAVARLNEAGVRCGVLIAPVLPGLSDSPEQLEAVVKACVEAGARSISHDPAAPAARRPRALPRTGWATPGPTSSPATTSSTRGPTPPRTPSSGSASWWPSSSSATAAAPPVPSTPAPSRRRGRSAPAAAAARQLGLDL